MGFQLRYGSVATTPDAYTDATGIVPWTPVGGGVLAANLWNGTLFTGNMGTRVFLVTNSGLNSVDLNVQHLHVTGQTWVDSTATGAAYALGAGDSVGIEVGAPSTFTRLRVRNTAAGSSSTISAQYRAIALVR